MREPSPFDKGGCSYVAGRADFLFADYRSLVAYAGAMEQQIRASQAAQTSTAKDLETKAQAFKHVQDISAVLSDYFPFDRGGILKDVLARTNSESPGFIRTPSVVLSKSSTEDGPVGGHNIALTPHRVPTPPRLKQEEVIAGRIEREVLHVSSEGSLLAEMRRVLQASSATNIPADVLRRASACGCDALISQGEGGIIYVVRNVKSQQVQQVVLGKSGVITALSDPANRVLRFENFDPITAENLSRSIALLRPQPGWQERAVRAVKDLFAPEKNPRTTTATLWTKDQMEMLRLAEGGEPGSVVALNQPLSWRSARIETATRDTWQRVAGESGMESGAVIVRFGDGQTSIGVLVRGASDQKAAREKISRSLINWIPTRPQGAEPMAASLAELRKKLQLPDGEVQFYVSTNKGKLRVTLKDRGGDPRRFRAGHSVATQK
ncbi:MAG: hypothetical protein K1X70_09670 [Leptospirales bacterium]|nr:hypothetical protein [Leptospirales bacterium]